MLRGLGVLAFVVAASLPAQAGGLTGPTLFQFQPYFDGQSGNQTGVGVEQQPTLAGGYTSRTSKLLITPVGDGSVVRVEAWLNLATADVTAPPAANHSFMLIAGLPPFDSSGFSWGFAGQYQGFQFAQGGMLSLDATSLLTDPNGGRWYVVVAYPDSLPVNCEWNKDTNVHLIHPCWLADKTADTGSADFGHTPMRLKGTLSYVTTWAAVGPWLMAQEAAHKVVQLSPALK